LFGVRKKKAVITHCNGSTFGEQVTTAKGIIAKFKDSWLTRAVEVQEAVSVG
jgi:hypothetical protein